MNDTQIKILSSYAGQKVGNTMSLKMCIVLHIVFLIIGLSYSSTLDADLRFSPELNNFLGISVYTGLFTFFLRGKNTLPYPWIPIIAGIVQGLAIIGYSLDSLVFIFWMGAQAWFQRAIMLRWKIGKGGWYGAFFICICILCLYMPTENMPTTMPMEQLWPAVPIGVIGYFYQRTQIHRRESFYVGRMAMALERLKSTVNGKVLPKPLQEPASDLLKFATMYMDRRPKNETLSHDFLDTLVDTIGDLEKQSGVVQKTLGSFSRWPQQLMNKNVTDPEILAARINAINKDLSCLLGDGKKPTQNAKEEEAPKPENLLYVEYEKQADDLREASASLPESSAQYADSIVQSVYNMVRSMRGDERDRPGGEKFLNTYLPATQKVVNGYCKLTDDGLTKDHKAFAKSEEILKKLAQAFADEYSNMLKNDTVDYTAEINALDTMLKMRGYSE